MGANKTFPELKIADIPKKGTTTENRGNSLCQNSNIEKPANFVLIKPDFYNALTALTAYSTPGKVKSKLNFFFFRQVLEFRQSPAVVLHFIALFLHRRLA